MQEQAARYEGATREEALAQYQADATRAEAAGYKASKEDWYEEEGRPVLLVTYQQAGVATTQQAGPASTQPSSDVIYDQISQYQQILPWIVRGEKLYGVLDCKGAGTGFVAITNKRIMFYDKAPLRKRKALMSVPYSKVTAVGSVDQGRGLLGASSELVVKTGSEEYDFEFRGGEKAQLAYRWIMEELLQEESA